jgi:hypothetical protein
MADMMALIKRQSEKGISELRDLSAKLSARLKHLINFIPENTRQKSVEAFLNDIRTSVLGEAPRRSSRRAKKPSTPRRTVRVSKVVAKRGRKKKKASSVTEEQKPT